MNGWKVAEKEWKQHGENTVHKNKTGNQQFVVLQA